MDTIISRIKMPCMKRAVRETIPRGMRNELAIQYASACFKDDIPKQRALSIAKDFYRYCETNDDFSYEEVEKCFKWVYEHEEKDVFVNCNTIAKAGWCKEDDKKICELYHYRKIHNSQKKLIKYLKERSKECEGWAWVSFNQIKETADTHQIAIINIFFDDLGCERPTHMSGKRCGEPADYVFVKEEQINKLEKNMKHYAEIHARNIVKEVLKQPSSFPPNPEERLRITEETRKKHLRRAMKNRAEMEAYEQQQKEQQQRAEMEAYEQQRKKQQQKRAVEPIKREATQPQKKATVEKPKNRGGRPRKKIDKQKIFQLRKEGKSIPEIAKQLNVSVGFVHKRLKEGEVKE